MRKVMVLVVLLALVVGCAPRVAPAPAPAAAPTSPMLEPAVSQGEVKGKPAWETEWEATLNKARREGKVIIYSSGGAEERRAYSEAFKKKYQLNVEYVAAGRSALLTQKIFTERRAGIYAVDAFVSGTTSMVTELKPSGILDPVEPELILPDLTDPAKVQKVWLDGKLYFVDQKTRTILSFAAYPNDPMAINTELVKPEELKSYRDLLKPKFKEKIIMSNPTISGSGAKWFQIVSNYLLDVEFMKELAKQKPLIMDDLRLMTDWLAHGKYLVLIGPKPVEITEFRRAGAPVAMHTPVEGSYLTSGGGNIVLIKNRPNPYATRIFLNWLLSQEGQTLFTQVSERQSRRLDISLGNLSPDRLREPGVKYLESEKEEILIKADESYKLAKEIFGHLMK